MPDETNNVTTDTTPNVELNTSAPPEAPPASSTPAPASTPLINPDGTYAEGWLDRLDVDDEVKQDQQLRTHKGPADTAKNLHELMKIRGLHVVPIPPEGSDDPKLWDTVYSRLGRPETPDGYTAPSLDGIPEQHRMPDEMLKGVRELMHKNGLTDRQWQGVVSGWNEMVKTQLEAAEANRAKALDPLKAEWQNDFDANVQLTEKFLRSTVPAERFDAALAAVKTNPDLMKILHERAAATAEGEPSLETAPPQVVAAAQAELTKIQSSGKDGPYHNRYHPEHAAIVQRANELRKLIAAATPKKPPEQGFSLQV